MSLGAVSLVAMTLGAVLGCSTERETLRTATQKPVDPVILLDDDAGTKATPLNTDAHALLGIEPARGPFNGGQFAIIRGNGFTGDTRVWFGDAEVPKSDLVALDPNRLQVNVPPGAVGPVDVSCQSGKDLATRRVLPSGYRYESFFVEPTSGTTRGGTPLTLTGKSTNWTKHTLVQIDGAPCTDVSVRELPDEVQELDCTTPAGTPGAKTVTTTDAADAGAGVSINGAFTYVQSATNFKGGLAGDALDDQLDVTLLDDVLGEPLPGAYVGLGRGADGEPWATTDEDGVAHFSGKLGPKQTITAGGKCLQPITLFDVTVDSVTLYLEPVLSPACLSIDFNFPSVGGGNAGSPPLRQVKGFLSWGTGVELKQTAWRGVPEPKDEQEQQAAYVFELNSNSDGEFSLPSHIYAVSNDDRGPFGYPFEYDTTSDANITLYALAGLERTVGTSRVFAPYVMGIERGIVPGNDELRPILMMDIPLDHELALDVDPLSQVAGQPDLLQMQIGLRVGRLGFISLPGQTRTAPLPLLDAEAFRGVPALGGALADAEYVANVKAVTGSGAALPIADVEAVATKNVDEPIGVGNFIAIPRFDSPENASTWDGREIELHPKGGDNFDLWSLRVDGAGDLFFWRIVAPREHTKLELPDLARWQTPIPSGVLTIRASAARIADFDYAEVRQRSFNATGWAAYSANVVSVEAP
ncbi:MAG TPA: IPT/TIG domain-containing protein [Polyangiaceae bacterium]|nr:IPT/TIG domain-containing protein [Polyangiaceae bacterium]